jgi:formate dehydrogenase
MANDAAAAATPIRMVFKPRGHPKGRVVDPAALAQVREMLGQGAHPPDLLLEYLHRIQDAYGCLSAAHLTALAAQMKLSMAEVFEVASFYHHFDIVKDGEAKPPAVTVRVCDSLACEMAGSADLLERLPGLLGAGVRVLRAPCVGRCDRAPIAVVGRNPVPRATAQAVSQAVSAEAFEHPFTNAELAPAAIGFEPYRREGGYRLLAECAAGRRPWEELAATMDHAGLRGLGGAGFPAGRKWKLVRAQPGPRLVAVNIDEGEPGTFKDRHYLERDPHRFLEGMLVAAWVVEARDVYIYLRDEYAGCRLLLARAIEELQADPPCALPAIHLRRGAGAYICGEESAMIESIEGKRGMPRLRPPYLAQVGLFGRPTLEHNMETLFWIREIAEKGAAWFASQGRHGRAGLRSFSVSGRVKKPGVHLAPAGITAKELIAEFCGGMQEGHAFYGYLPGGASGGILPASMGDVPLDFDTLQEHGCFIGSAAVIVLSDRDRAVDAARNVMRFFADESCGQCTPCRVGTAKAADLMQERVWDRELLEELSHAMAEASICGLGQAAPNPIRCVIKYFPEEIR